MPAREDLPEGAPAWIDLAAADLDASITFYTSLFGWEHTSYGEEFGGYGQFLLDGEPVTGVGPLQDPSQSPGWGVYLWTDDAEATAARVIAHGGTVLVPPTDVPGQGRFVMTADPTGAPVGFWQAGGHRGFARVAEAGAPAWFELWTDDFDRAVAYYRDVARWDPQDLASDGQPWRYVTHGEGDGAHAGIYDAAADLEGKGAPTWVVYFGTADVDASLVRARALGVTVHGEPQDTPYGRVVGVQDPSGTWFQLVSV